MIVVGRPAAATMLVRMAVPHKPALPDSAGFVVCA